MRFVVGFLVFLLLSVGFLGLFMFEVGADGITRVQSKVASVTNKSCPYYYNVSLDSTPVSGNVLVLVYTVDAWNTFFNVSAISQTNVVWVQLIQVDGDDWLGYTAIWLGVVSGSASNSVNMTIGSSSSFADFSCIICEYSGILTVGYLDKTDTNTGTSTSGDTGTTVETTQANELWVGVVGCGMVAEIDQSSPTNGFTLIGGETIDYAGVRISCGYLEKIVSSVGEANSGVTIESESYFGGCIVTLKGSGGGDTYVGSCSGVLNAPVDDAEIDYFECKFNYTAQLVGNSSDYFSNSTLYVNNTAVAYNASVIVNNTLSTISYTLGGNGTYLWDVFVWNSTHGVWSGNGNFTLVVGVYEEENLYVGECSLVLNAPVDDAEIDYSVVLFNFTGLLVGNSSDYFVLARLYCNNSLVASNSSEILNNTLVSLSYELPENGTYVWDIRLWNSTDAVWSSNGNFTLVAGWVESGVTLEELNNAVWMVVLLAMGFCLMVTAVWYKRRDGS